MVRGKKDFLADSKSTKKTRLNVDEREKMTAINRRKFVTAAIGAGALMTAADVVAASREEDTLTIRGHHLFDLLGALATGKSSHKTLGPVAKKIRANPMVSIKVVVGVDDICSPCEWWDHDQGLCTKNLDKYPNDNRDSVTSDKNAIRTLGLKPGDVMKADDLYRLIQRKVTKKVFAEKVCVACRLVDKCKESYEKKIAAAVETLTKSDGPESDAT